MPTAAVLECAVRHSRSAEDLLLLPLLLMAAKRYGNTQFVELGGYDGESGSQTWLLEKCYGWRGTLIEASPINFAALEKADRKARLVHSGVCKPAGKLTMTVGSTPSSVTGVAGAMSDTHMRAWGHFLQRNVSVPCKPLMQLVRQQRPAGAAPASAKAPIAFLSLDVEGAEEMVLRTIPAEHGVAFPFSVVLVEVNRLAPRDGALTPSSERVLAMLRGAGLKRMPIPRSIGSENALFARPELASALADGEARGRASQHDAVGSRDDERSRLRDIVRNMSAARTLPAHATARQPHMGGPAGFVQRALHGLLHPALSELSVSRPESVTA